MKKNLENFTESPKQRFPGDRKFKNNESPAANNGCKGKVSKDK